MSPGRRWPGGGEARARHLAIRVDEYHLSRGVAVRGSPEEREPDDRQIDLRRFVGGSLRVWQSGRYPLPLGTIAVLRKARNGRRAWEAHRLNKRITQDELSVMWDALASELGDTLIAVYQLDVLPFRRVGV